MNLVILIFIFSLNLIAAVSSGENFKAQYFNSSSAQIGDIKKSLLTESQFTSLYGTCWKLVDTINLQETDLGVLTGFSSIPSLKNEGLFLRQAKSGRTLGSIEQDDLKSHSHTLRISNSAGSDPNSMVARNGGTGGNGGISSGSSSYINTGSTGTTQTVPKNIAINMFVKVNKSCLFN